MATVRDMLTHIAEPGVIKRVTARGFEDVRRDEVVRKIIRKYKIRPADAKLLVGTAIIRGAEAMWQELKKELPWG